MYIDKIGPWRAKDTGGRLNIKMPSYQYMDSHVKEKPGLTDRLIFNMGIPYLEKTAFILRQFRALWPGVTRENRPHRK